MKHPLRRLIGVGMARGEVGLLRTWVEGRCCGSLGNAWRVYVWNWESGLGYRLHIVLAPPVCRSHLARTLLAARPYVAACSSPVFRCSYLARMPLLAHCSHLARMPLRRVSGPPRRRWRKPSAILLYIVRGFSALLLRRKVAYEHSRCCSCRWRGYAHEVEKAQGGA